MLATAESARCSSTSELLDKAKQHEREAKHAVSQGKYNQAISSYVMAAGKAKQAEDFKLAVRYCFDCAGLYCEACNGKDTKNKDWISYSLKYAEEILKKLSGDTDYGNLMRQFKELKKQWQLYVIVFDQNSKKAKQKQMVNKGYEQRLQKIAINKAETEVSVKKNEYLLKRGACTSIIDAEGKVPGGYAAPILSQGVFSPQRAEIATSKGFEAKLAAFRKAYEVNDIVEQINYYESIGDDYVKRGRNIDAVAMYNWGIGLCKSALTSKEFKKDIRQLEKKCIGQKLLVLKEINASFNEIDFCDKEQKKQHASRETLLSIRNKTLQNLKKVSKSGISELYKEINKALRSFLSNLIKGNEELLISKAKIAKPCEYCVVLLGSFARDEATPRSDIEFLILIENENQSKVFFKYLVKLLQIDILNLGETTPRFHHIKELTWLLPRSAKSPVEGGLSFDAQMYGACKTPLGNMHLDLIPECSYKLIHSPNEMAKLCCDFRLNLKKSKDLFPFLRNTAYLYGNRELLKSYRQCVSALMRQGMHPSGEFIQELPTNLDKYINKKTGLAACNGEELKKQNYLPPVFKKLMDLLSKCILEFWPGSAIQERNNRWILIKYHLYRGVGLLIDYLVLIQVLYQAKEKKSAETIFTRYLDCPQDIWSKVDYLFQENVLPEQGREKLLSTINSIYMIRLKHCCLDNVSTKRLSVNSNQSLGIGNDKCNDIYYVILPFHELVGRMVNLWTYNIHRKKNINPLNDPYYRELIKHQYSTLYDTSDYRQAKIKSLLGHAKQQDTIVQLLEHAAANTKDDFIKAKCYEQAAVYILRNSTGLFKKNMNEAIALYEKLNCQGGNQGLYDVNIAKCYNTFALHLRSDKSRIKESKTYLLMSVRLMAQFYSTTNHPNILAFINNQLLFDLLDICKSFNKNDFKSIIRLHVLQLNRKEFWLGYYHKSTYFSYKNLGLAHVLYACKGETILYKHIGLHEKCQESRSHIKKAIGYYRHAEKIARQLYGAEHFFLGQILNYIGRAEVLLGENLSAQQHFERAITLLKKFQNQKYDELYLSYYSLGELYYIEHDKKNAKEYFEKAKQGLCVERYKDANDHYLNLINNIMNDQKTPVYLTAICN